MSFFTTYPISQHTVKFAAPWQSHLLFRNIHIYFPPLFSRKPENAVEKPQSLQQSTPGSMYIHAAAIAITSPPPPLTAPLQRHSVVVLFLFPLRRSVNRAWKCFTPQGEGGALVLTCHFPVSGPRSCLPRSFVFARTSSSRGSRISGGSNSWPPFRAFGRSRFHMSATGVT